MRSVSKLHYSLQIAIKATELIPILGRGLGWQIPYLKLMGVEVLTKVLFFRFPAPGFDQDQRVSTSNFVASAHLITFKLVNSADCVI